MKAFRNSAIALTVIGGLALFAAPASANPMTNHQTFIGDSAKSSGVTDVGWRRYYRRHWAGPAYLDYGPRYYDGPGLFYDGPGPDFSVGIY
jgi:hypothetical protein